MPSYGLECEAVDKMCSFASATCVTSEGTHKNYCYTVFVLLGSPVVIDFAK